MSSTSNEPAIIRGIKTVGIGKKGSKPLSIELIQELIEDLKAGKVHPVSRAAFFAALVIKGVTNDEMLLDKVFSSPTLTNPNKLSHELTSDAPVFVQEICAEILKGQILDKESAYRLGKFLFSNEHGDGARGLVASALRVRYETPDEYQGFLAAMQETIETPFHQKVPAGEPIVQFAEPFDGVDSSYVITPLLADFVQTLGFRAVTLVGRNSGPKKGNNVLDLIQAMKVAPAKSNTELENQKKPDFGWYINQQNLSTAVDRWVEIRRLTIKRPFLATLERFLNPTNAHIIVASAYHPPYTEKMTTVAQRAGFAGTIIIRNGQEGSLSFALSRPVKILCTALQCEGEYTKNEIEINPGPSSGAEIKVDEKLINPSLQENARLIYAFKEKGKSGNEFFDNRVKITCAGLKEAIQWIKKKLPAISSQSSVADS